ncbi:uracil-DNA glycosylase [Leucobacter sp. gxy201]|uniref:uracil-DNA glycosylase n=1 Tax=Leucobacter sp. gxy201 TaxID=2957200 RepID=UPI003DA012E3
MAMTAGGALGSGIAADWAEVLAPVRGTLAELEAFLDAERAAGEQVLPAERRILAAFERPLADVRVLIVGQDPYPTPGHSIGLAFAVQPEVRPIPRSLRNIYRELHDDLGIAPADHGDLTAWADRGVMLLNRVLTVRAGQIASHRRKGWETVTAAAIRALASRGGPLVAILWGNDARALAPVLGDVPCIESPHPSPLSASRGFFGSRPFSRANAALAAQGSPPIDWSLA